MYAIFGSTRVCFCTSFAGVNCCVQTVCVQVPAESTRSPPTTHGDGGQQPLRHVRHNDADEEDDGLQPSVAQDERQDEEGHAKKDGYARDDVDEVLDLDVDGRTTDLQLRCQRGDAAHHCVVTRGDHNAPNSTCRSGGGHVSQPQGNRQTV